METDTFNFNNFFRTEIIVVKHATSLKVLLHLL